MKLLFLMIAGLVALPTVADGGVVSGEGQGATRPAACESARASARHAAMMDAVGRYAGRGHHIASYGACDCQAPEDDNDRWTCSVTARWEVDE